jgi:mannosyltransferase
MSSSKLSCVRECSPAAEMRSDVVPLSIVPPARRSHFPELAAVLLGALAIRLPYLGSMSLWLDEIWSIGTARLPYHSIFWVTAHKDSNASLYYVVLHLWLKLGHSELWVRSLSLALGVITIPLLYKLGNDLLGKPVGLFASMLLMVSKLHIIESQDTRTYTMTVLLITLASLFFVRSIEQPSFKNWSAYVILSALAIYGHVFSLLVVGGHAASLIFLRRREVPWKGVLASGTVLAASVVPLGFLLHDRMAEPEVPLEWAPRVSVPVVGRFFWSLAGGSHYGISVWFVVGVVLCIAYLGLCLIGIGHFVQLWREYGRSMQTWRLGLVLSWFFVPIAICIVLSLSKPLLVDKYLIVCIPALVMLAAQGGAVLRPKWGATWLGCMVILATLALVPYFQKRQQDREWQMATATILSQAQPGDAIIFMVAPGRLLYNYYGGPNSANSPDVLYPLFGDEFTDPRVLLYVPPVNSKLLAEAPQRYQRVWMVRYHDTFPSTKKLSDSIQGTLEENYQVAQETWFDGTPNYEKIHLVLYTNKDQASQPAAAAAASSWRMKAKR